jgi:hypothetical protein
MLRLHLFEPKKLRIIRKMSRDVYAAQKCDASAMLKDASIEITKNRRHECTL